VIRLAGYTEEEKLKIAKKYLVPRQIKAHGLTARQFKITNEAILKIISQYTREAGLRNLERTIANVCRKVAKSVATGKKNPAAVTPKDLSKFLGVPIFDHDGEQEKDMVGVATGIAWTAVGGEVMHVEASATKGNGKLILTGKLGDVMKESAQAALSYIKSRGAEFGLPDNFTSNTDIHIHVPAGAIPKDGPSAGVTMAVALVSALTGTPVRHDITMTGEITLRGRVLPIGGLKEKSLAARRAGIKEIIIPDTNKKDLAEMPDNIRKEVKFHLAKTADQVLNLALTKKLKVLKKERAEKVVKAAKKKAKLKNVKR
jgi:ATP-dependent Lon protease